MGLQQNPKTQHYDSYSPIIESIPTDADMMVNPAMVKPTSFKHTKTLIPSKLQQQSSEKKAMTAAKKFR